MAKTSQTQGLNELMICLGEKVPHFTEQKFRRCTAHIGLMFLRYLKQYHAYVLDGSPMLFVHLGVPEAQRELLGPKHYFQQLKGGWSSCCVPKFEYAVFSTLSDAKQDEQTTALVEKALFSVAKQVGADAKPIREAASAIRSSEYSLRFPIPSLRCPNPKGNQIAQVYSCISRGMIRWQVVIEQPDGEPIRSEWIPDDCYRLPGFTEDALVARWDKQGLTLRNEKGRTMFVVPPLGGSRS